MTYSGQIYGTYEDVYDNVYDGSLSTSRYNIRLYYEYEQDIANNQSIITHFELQARTRDGDPDDSPYSYEGQSIGYASYGGYSVNRSDLTFDLRTSSWVTLMSLNNKVIQHASDGTKIIGVATTFFANDRDGNSVDSCADDV